jgi:hypothetical protein
MKIANFEEYKKEKCVKCANKDTDLCYIKRIIDGSVNCVYFKDTKEEEASNELYKRK